MLYLYSGVKLYYVYVGAKYVYVGDDCSKMLNMGIFNYSEVKNVISVSIYRYIRLNCTSIYEPRPLLTGYWKT